MCQSALLITLAVLFTLSVMSSGQGLISCYQCNSGVDRDCETLDVNNRTTHYRRCGQDKRYQGEKPFCRKIEQTIFVREDMVRVVRGCGWKRHPKEDCYRLSDRDHKETVCQCFTDGCNEAGGRTSGVVSVVLWSVCAVFSQATS